MISTHRLYPATQRATLCYSNTMYPATHRAATLLRQHPEQHRVTATLCTRQNTEQQHCVTATQAVPSNTWLRQHRLYLAKHRVMAMQAAPGDTQIKTRLRQHSITTTQAVPSNIQSNTVLQHYVPSNTHTSLSVCLSPSLSHTHAENPRN